jgi:glycosyltransferase involved in cell wall biosynthesis
MPDPPAIGVVIPCFNQGRYLDEAVDSVFAQTRGDFEIFVVDDGSTDPETRRLLAGYERPRTRVVRTENRGLPAARNAGIRLAENPYICCLDADDRLAPTWFEKALEVLEEDPSVSFVSHWLSTFGDQEWDWTPERCDLAALLDMNTVNGAAVVRRRDLQAVGLFDESWRDGCEDWDLWLTLVERGCRGVILPEVLFHYRRRPGSMSREMNRPARQLDLFRRLIEKHAASYRTHLLDLLQRRETNLGDLLGEIHDLEREHRSWWSPELERRRAEVEALRRKLEEVHRRRAEEVERQRIAADLEGHRKSLRNAEGEIADLRRIQAEHVEEIARQQAELEEGRGALRRAEEAEEHLAADLEGHRQALRHATEEIAALRRIQAEHAGEIRRLADDLEERREALGRSEETRKRLAAELEDHRRARRRAEDENARLAVDVESHRRSLRDAEEEIAGLRRIAAERVEEGRHLEADLEGHRRSLRQAGDEIADLRRQLAELRGSWSWRLAAPLRAVLGGLRKIGGDRS